MLPALVTAGLGLASLLSSRSAQKKQIAATAAANDRAAALQAEANRQALADKEQDRELQREFAKSGIQWRVADATAAGIHPMYALGAQTPSYTPSAVQIGVPGVVPEVAADTTSGALASMGQDLSRALTATRSQRDREAAYASTLQGLALEKAGLENQLLATQIAKLRGQVGPPIPSGGALPPVPEATSQDGRPLLQFGGNRISTDPTTSNFDEFSKRYGDEGLPQWVIAPGIMWRDWLATSGTQNPLWALDRATAMDLPQIPSRGEIQRGMSRGWYPR